MPDKRAVYFDVDQTLINWDSTGKQELILQDGDFKYHVSAIQEHVLLMKEFKAVGWQVVVWSQGGADHAERVVKLLGMEKYVDLIVSKPQVYVDDLPLEQQYLKRVYKVCLK